MRWMVILTLFSQILFHTSVNDVQTSTVLANVQAEYQYGEVLSVQASYTGSQNLQNATLDLQTSNKTTYQYPLSATSQGTLFSQIKLGSLTIPPFSRVYYWFDLTFADGTTYASPAYWFDYLDNRYSWQTNQSKWFNINWVKGNTAYGAGLQDLALAGLKNATKVLPISPNLPITIYVYPDAQAAQSILSSTDPDWISGAALPQSNLIVVSASADLNSTQDLERQIPHELTHLLEYQITRENYSSNPAWLLEGLATTSETYPNPDYARILQKAGSTHNLNPMNQLCHAFSPDTQEASLAYAQSASFVQYLTSRFGTAKIIQLLQSSGNGLDCSQVESNILGVNLETLDSNWQAGTFSARSDQNNWMKYWPLLLIVILALAVAIVLRRLFLKKREKENGTYQ